MEPSQPRGLTVEEAAMSITAERKSELINDFKQNDVDSGSPEVQVAILTDRIKNLTEHLKANKHDFACRRGLTIMVSKRGRHLRYLAKKDRSRYLGLIQRLGLRR